MDIPRLRLLAGSTWWALRIRVRGLKDRIPRPRLTTYDVETLALGVAYVVMAVALVVLLADMMRRGAA